MLDKYNTDLGREMNDKKTFCSVLLEKGFEIPSDYAKIFESPGTGTLEKYMQGLQDPITGSGHWRKAPQTIAENLGVPIESLFPDTAARRQEILDQESMAHEGLSMTMLNCVRCPLHLVDDLRPQFVLVDLTCATCPFRSELTGNRLRCTHENAGNV